MSDPNPFRPPTTELRDAPAPVPPPKPRVRLASRLALLSFALGLFTLLPGVDPTQPGFADGAHWLTVPVLIVMLGTLTLCSAHRWMQQVASRPRS